MMIRGLSATPPPCIRYTPKSNARKSIPVYSLPASLARPSARGRRAAASMAFSAMPFDFAAR
eukprot:3891077-Rhodomonas_salina.1